MGTRPRERPFTPPLPSSDSEDEDPSFHTRINHRTFLNPSQLTLRFNSIAEADFWRHVGEERARSLPDTILHASSAFFAIEGIPRLIKAGHANCIPLAMAAALISAIAAVLHYPGLLARNSPLAQQIKRHRAFTHVIVHTSLQIYVLYVISLPDMAACTSDRPATELLMLWLLWQALYPCLAAVPLVYSLPMQLVLTVCMLYKIPSMCSVGFTKCTGGEFFYLRIAWGLNYASMVLPMPPLLISLDEIPPFRACQAVLAFLIVSMKLILFHAAIVQAELTARQRYALEKGDVLANLDLEKRRPALIPLLFYTGLKLTALWRVLELIYFFQATITTTAL